MLIDKLLNLILFVLSVLASFSFIFILLRLRLFILNRFVLLSFIVVCCLIRDVTKLMHLHEFFDPLAAIIEHRLLDTWLFDLFDLLFEAFAFSLKFFLPRSLDDFQVLPLFFSLFKYIFRDGVFIDA